MGNISNWSLESRIAVAPRRKYVLDRRLEGYTLKEIGADIGVCGARANQILAKANEAIEKAMLHTWMPVEDDIRLIVDGITFTFLVDDPDTCLVSNGQGKARKMDLRWKSLY
jgi:hypothetical protein